VCESARGPSALSSDCGPSEHNGRPALGRNRIVALTVFILAPLIRQRVTIRCATSVRCGFGPFTSEARSVFVHAPHFYVVPGLFVSTSASLP
jgi:hypothetical protein